MCSLVVLEADVQDPGAGMFGSWCGLSAFSVSTGTSYLHAQGGGVREEMR